MLVVILIVIAIVFIFYNFAVKPLNYWKDRGIKQGDPKWLFGDNWKLVSKSENLLEMVQRLYNEASSARYSGIYQFTLPTLLVKDLDLIKQISVKDFDHFTDHRTFTPEDADELLGKNLIALKGQRWRDMRNILSPSFTSNKMKIMFDLIADCAENFVQHFLNKKEEVVTIEFKDTFTRFTNDVIATTAFGVKVDSLDQPNNEFYEMGKQATNITGFWRKVKYIGYFAFPKLYKIVRIEVFPAEMNTFFRNLIGDTIKIREEKKIVRPDMIHLLMEAQKGIHKHEESNVIDTGFATAQESDLDNNQTKLHTEITETDIAAQAMIFFFAGFDTVSSLMCFLAYELAANPDIQDRLREEIRSTIKECNGKLTYEALLKMKYMDMVVSESLRKWPVASVTDRVCTKPYTIEPTTKDEKPIHLAKNDVIWIPIYGIHHDPNYYPDPERFDPERFNDENKENIKPYTYLPFGVGPRICIGSRFALLESKTVIFHILLNFELVPVEKSRIPIQVSRKQFNLNAEGGFWFGLKRIKASS